MLGFWWHINPHTAYKKQMVQGYFLAKDHFYICDSVCMVLWKWMHGPMEKDEVCLHSYLSGLVCDEMDVMFLGTCVPKNRDEC